MWGTDARLKLRREERDKKIHYTEVRREEAARTAEIPTRLVDFR